MANEPTKASAIPLEQPDRDVRIDGKTLVEIATERQLLQKADARIAALKARKSDARATAAAKVAEVKRLADEKEAELIKIRGDADAESDDDDDDNVLSPRAERILETLLWTVSLAMLHFTFDVLVQHQYGVSINWENIIIRAARAWVAFVMVFYVLHPHEANPGLLTFLAPKTQYVLRQMLFFALSIFSGCSLIYITNTSGYLYTMRRAPPLGCLWLWAVMELDLLWAVSSLAVTGVFMFSNGYTYK